MAPAAGRRRPGTVGCGTRLRGARSAGLLAGGAEWRRRALPRCSQRLDLDSGDQADAESFEHLAGPVDGDAVVLVALVAGDGGLMTSESARPENRPARTPMTGNGDIGRSIKDRRMEGHLPEPSLA